MTGAHYFGYLLVALSGVLLATHWQLWRDASLRLLSPAECGYILKQLQRRSVASGLIGVEGAAMTLIDRVPRTPAAISFYFFGLLIGGAVILAIGLADMRAMRQRRHVEHLDMVAKELRKAGATSAIAKPSTPPEPPAAPRETPTGRSASAK